MKSYEQKFIDMLASEVLSFDTPIYLTEKVTFNQNETVKKIKQHQNNGFSTKYKKDRIFYNIGNSRVDTAVKKIDLDTKDIQPKINKEGYQAANFLVKGELQRYFKETQHGTKLNELVEIFADEGNVVVKKDDQDIYRKVNLENLIVVDQTAETLEDTTVIEKHKYNPTEFKRIAKEGGWENWEDVLKTFIDDVDTKDKYIYVYERYGEMSLAEYKYLQGENVEFGDDGKYLMTISIAAMAEPKRDKTFTDSDISGYLMFCEDLKGETQDDGSQKFKPYKEAHYDAYQGRWLRKGIREKLFAYQERALELANQIREAMEWSTLHVFWSRDNKIAGRNVFKSIEQGQIIQADDLNILNVAERNLAAYAQEWNNLLMLADREAQSFEVATGESLPSGTTLGGMQLQTAAVGEYFGFKREKFGLFLKDVFNDWVVPELVKRITTEHNLEMEGSPEYMDLYMEAVVKGWIYRNYLKMMALAGRTVTPQELDQLVQLKKLELAKKPKLMVKVLRDFFKGIEVNMDVIITGETINKQNRINNGFQLLQLVTNPAVMQDPTSRGIVEEISDSLGFKLAKSPPQMEQQAPPQQQQMPAPQSAIPETERVAQPV